MISRAIKRMFPPLKQIQENYIREVLKFTGGNVNDAAEILEMDRRTLLRRKERRAK